MIRVVTDSASDIPPYLAAELGITVIPIRINMGTRIYYDGADIDRTDVYHRLTRSGILPTAEPPLLEEFQQVYGRLLKSTEQILSIHISSKLNKTVQVAQESTQAFLGKNKLTVVDSRLVSWGLELLVTMAAEAAQIGSSVKKSCG